MQRAVIVTLVDQPDKRIKVQGIWTRIFRYNAERTPEENCRYAVQAYLDWMEWDCVPIGAWVDDWTMAYVFFPNHPGVMPADL